LEGRKAATLLRVGTLERHLAAAGSKGGKPSRRYGPRAVRSRNRSVIIGGEPRRETRVNRRKLAAVSAATFILVAGGVPAQPPPSLPGTASAPPSTPPWQAATLWPDRIVVTFAGDPRTSFAVSWRTRTDVATARAEIIAAEDHSRFDVGAASVAASSESVALDTKSVDGQDYALGWNDYLDPVSYHSVTFAELEPDTVYAYRVTGAEGHWSEWYQTRTAPARAEPFKFLYFGDAQDGILSHWARVVRAAFVEAPDARFAVHAGDLVNIGSRDFEWAEWFESVGFIHGMIPAVPAVGNHEYFDGIRGEDNRPISALSALWRPQFTLPEYAELPVSLSETVYAVEYGDALIVVLNTMAGEFELQAQWLDETLASTDAPWKIVAMHHPMFELLDRRNVPGLEETGPERRAAFLPVFERHGVDLALQGHDHSYGRGATYAAAPRRGGSSGLGTVFVTTSAGAKMYPTSEQGWDAFAAEGAVLARKAENTQFFQVVSIDGDTLTFEARTATGRLYDAFRIEKNARGRNRVVELPTEIEDERTFESTGEYENPRLDTVPALPGR
jgi:hypothetical protein